ncbi:E3 ubiquitin-protein ligase RFWD3 isoform X1 [Glycine max]|nr:E3 ubiquitin-protein ligase RFWD3 isoform X1 [Glycine max]
MANITSAAIANPFTYPILPPPLVHSLALEMLLDMRSRQSMFNFELQVPAWSCSWDLNNSHYIYAGLQNGCVLVFDMCQTAGPMKSLVGLTRNPVHTVHSLSQTSSLSSGVKTILSASAIDLCQWNIDSEER